MIFREYESIFELIIKDEGFYIFFMLYCFVKKLKLMINFYGFCELEVKVIDFSW